MTVIENDNPKMHYQGPISSGDELPLDFPYTNAVDVKCMVDKSILVQGPDFTVSGLSVTIKRDVPAGSVVTIYRETPLDQQAEFPQNNKFSSQKINEALDKICMQQQEQSETLSRCITASISLENFNGELPTPAPKQVLMWNEDVTALENYDIIGENEAFQESIREELAETVENIEEELDDFKQETNQTISNFRSEVNENIQNFKDETDVKIDTFKQETNQTISDFRRETNDKIETFEGTVNTQITEIRNVANATTAVANEALQVANSTIDTANTALNAANRAVETANEASSKSETAVGTANLASENSYQAINTANEANVTAGNARDVADGAISTAAVASNIATAASTKVDEFGETIEVVIEAAGKIAELEGAVEEAKEAAGTATVAADAAVEAADAAIEALSSKQDKLTAGPGIRITEDNIIENTRESAEWGKITGNMDDQPDLTNKFNDIDEKIRDIELFKFPNAVIIGEPTIQNGQVSDFSTVSYLQFPFILDLHDQAFQIDFCFTTATNVQTQQNILDSNFGIALAIQNGKGVMAISSNGTSWDIGSATGSINIQSNTTYYARLTWNKLQYKTFLSTDGVSYTQDMVLTGAVRPYPRTIYIGGCDQLETGHTGHPFLGTINMNKAIMSVNNQVIWQGMDDAGLSTRADLSLSNLDELGEARFDSKQDKIFWAEYNVTPYEDVRFAVWKNKVVKCNYNNHIYELSSSDYAPGTTYVFINYSGINVRFLYCTSGSAGWLYGEQIELAKTTDLSVKQDTLVSGTNIKTINGESVLGSGDLEVGGSDTFWAEYGVTTFDEAKQAFDEGKTVKFIRTHSGWVYTATTHGEMDMTFLQIYSGSISACVLNKDTGWSGFTSRNLLPSSGGKSNNVLITDDYGSASWQDTGTIYPVISTYVNGTSGYRIWSDGYCEQWGRTTAGSSATKNVSLLKTFSNTNYIVLSGNEYTTTMNVTSVVKTGTKSVGSFDIIDSTTATVYTYWKACGYLAAGQY